MRRIRNEQSHVISFIFGTCLNVDARDGRGLTGRTWTDGTDVDGRDGTWTDVDGRDGRDGTGWNREVVILPPIWSFGASPAAESLEPRFR